MVIFFFRLDCRANVNDIGNISLYNGLQKCVSAISKIALFLYIILKSNIRILAVSFNKQSHHF